MDYIIVHFHLFPKLSPYILDCKLVVRMNETIKPNNVKVTLMLLGHVCDDILNKLYIVSTS